MLNFSVLIINIAKATIITIEKNIKPSKKKLKDFTYNELADLLAKGLEHKKDETIADILLEIDLNNDGKIKSNEVTKWVQRNIDAEYKKYCPLIIKSNFIFDFVNNLIKKEDLTENIDNIMGELRKFCKEEPKFDLVIKALTLSKYLQFNDSNKILDTFKNK